MDLEFEEFCIGLKEKQLSENQYDESVDNSEKKPELNTLSEDENSTSEVEVL